MNHSPSGEVLSEDGRDGRVEASDGSFSLSFKPGDDGRPAATPEHLFAAAYAACFHSALKAAATSAHHTLVGSTVIAHVHIAESDSGASVLTVDLRASLPGLSEAHARKLLHQAHDRCPYSRAVRGNIPVTLSLD